MKPLPLLLLLAGCATAPPPRPADAFFERLTGLCGRAYEGRLVEDSPTPSPDFAGKAVVMHVSWCTADEIRIPVRVGDDRSRTWILTRTATGLRLKHDHRHEDGSSDALTMYGGETAGPGTAIRQEVPADAESIALFTRTGREVSNSNIWGVEIRPGHFAYDLRRPPIPGGRFFRVEFDLTRPIPAPPPPWGAQ